LNVVLEWWRSYFSLSLSIYIIARFSELFKLFVSESCAKAEQLLFDFSLTFYIYYNKNFTVYQISICRIPGINGVIAAAMRAGNLTKNFKFRTNVRSWKFDFKSQILGGLPTAPSRSSLAAPKRSSNAAASRRSSPGRSCLEI